MVEGTARVDPALQLAEVLQLTGDVPRAEALVVSARELAVAAGDARRIARCDHSLAESARRLGRFDDAAERLWAARTGFGSIGDEAGVAEALQVTGTVNAQRGNLADARAAYEGSLAIRERLGDEDGAAGIINNLGIVAQHDGDLARARELMTRALEMYTALGNRRRLSSCEINLAWLESAAGDHEAAIRHGEEAIRLSREVGDRLNLAIAHNNLGDALRDEARLAEAGTAYAAAIEAYRDLGNPGPLMALFEDVAVLLAKQTRHADALRLVGAADALREALGSSRPEAAEAELDERLAQARASVGEAEAAVARAAGASLSRGDAIDMALDSVRGHPV